MKIGDRIIGSGGPFDPPPYVVAEISGNHCGDFVLAKHLIKAAKRAGADAVKTQCYDADSLTLDARKVDFIVQNGLWKGRTLYELYQKAHTPPAWHKDLYKVANGEGITIFSSVFDKRGVDLLEGLGCPCYKIASFEITDTPLIEYAASTGKPLIISTGLADSDEIRDANEASREKAAFLHCTSEYPAGIESANLRRIEHLRALLRHGTPVGISDHTMGDMVPAMATALRVAIIEKHLKLAGAEVKSEDDAFSLNPMEFAEMVATVKAADEAMREKPTDLAARQFRRSLYVVADIKKGEIYTENNVRSIRPGYGLAPRLLTKILGRKSPRDWRRGDPLS